MVKNVFGVVLASVSLVAGVYAVDWDGGAATANWTDGANWNPDGTPGSTDLARIQGGNLVDFNSAGTETIDRLRLGVSNGSQSGEVDVQSGTLLVTGASGTDSYRDGSGTVRVSGGTFEIGGSIRFAHRTGSTDAIIVTAGTFRSTGRMHGGEHGGLLVDVSGGLLEATGSHFDLISARGALGGPTVLNVSGTGVLDIKPTFGYNIGTSSRGDTTVNQTGGSTLAESIRIGQNAVGDVIYNLDGGVVNAGTINLHDTSFNFGDGTLQVNDINTTAGTTFAWDGGTLSSRNAGDNFDVSFNGDLTTTTGSAPTLDLGNIFISAGNQMEQLNVSGALDLAASDDVLDIMDTVYFLRGFGNAFVNGSLPLVDADSLAPGEFFDSVVGPTDVSRAANVFTSTASGLADSIAALGKNEYAIHYDAFTGNVNFIYNVSQTIPEPSTTGLILLGLGGLIAARRKEDEEGLPEYT